MYGHLVPCRGGKSIPLNKNSLCLGKRVGKGPGQRENFCEFSRSKKGEWSVKALNDQIEVRVNGHPIDELDVKSGDLIAIGKLRYRLELVEEEQDSKSKADSERTRAGSVLSLFGFGKKQATSGEEEHNGPPVLGVLIPSRGGKAIPLRKQRNTIGREETCDVVIKDMTVSTLHCGLEYTQGYWRVVDLGSTNGIMVNGIAYQKKWLLPGEELMISLNRYKMEYQPDGDLPDDEDVPYTGRSLTDIAGIGENEATRISERHESLEDRLFGEKTRMNSEEEGEEYESPHFQESQDPGRD